MLKFTYKPESIDTVIKTFISGFAEIMRSTRLTTIACNHYDKDLENNMMTLIKKTDNGFVFDEEDQIGEEPYGYVSDFFESHLNLLSELKSQFGSLSIEGYVFVNDLGPYECTMRKRVHTTADMDVVEFVDQLQCIHCFNWIDVKDAHILLEDDDIGEYPDRDGEPLYPGIYAENEVCIPFCVCSEECSEAANPEN